MLLKGVIWAPLSNSNLEMLKASLRAFLEAHKRGEKGAIFGDASRPHLGPHSYTFHLHFQKYPSFHFPSPTFWPHTLTYP